MSNDRPARPNLDELRAVVQPPEILGRRNAEHWTGNLYMRRYSIYLTNLLVRTPISANGVTGLMILVGISAAAALLIPGLPGALLAALLAQLQMYIDCSDGEVARWRGVSSPAGVFLDKVGHYSAEGLIGLALGIRASGVIGGQETDPVEIWKYCFCGAFLMAWILFNKALNDMVHISRAFAGLDRLADTAQAKQVSATSLIGRLRKVARFLPFHRILHSIELTLLALAVAIIALFCPPLAAERVLVVVLAVATPLVTLGHFLAIMASPRLRR